MFLTEYLPFSSPWIYILMWFIVVIISIAIEINTFQIVSIWFAASGLVSMILAAFSCKIEVQVITFIVLSVVLFTASRPFVKKINQGKSENSTIESLIEEEVIVIKTIKVGEIGEIKAKYEKYSAIAPNVKTDILPNTKVKIIEIRGNKVIVDLI